MALAVRNREEGNKEESNGASYFLLFTTARAEALQAWRTRGRFFGGR
jgi:hypothetical protein